MQVITLFRPVYTFVGWFSTPML